MAVFLIKGLKKECFRLLMKETKDCALTLAK